MKTILTTVAATFFAASVSAGSIYNGFQQNNPDLHGAYSDGSDQMSAVQPGVGSAIDRYQGWAEGNSDLFADTPVSTSMSRTGSADVYRGFAGSPDL